MLNTHAYTYTHTHKHTYWQIWRCEVFENIQSKTTRHPHRNKLLLVGDCYTCWQLDRAESFSTTESKDVFVVKECVEEDGLEFSCVSVWMVTSESRDDNVSGSGVHVANSFFFFPLTVSFWCTFRCLFFSSERANLRPHLSQANGFSPVCVRMWVVRWSDLVNLLMQIWQRKGLSPVCLLICLVSSSDRLNLESQYWQAWGLSEGGGGDFLGVLVVALGTGFLFFDVGVVLVAVWEENVNGNVKLPWRFNCMVESRTLVIATGSSFGDCWMLRVAKDWVVGERIPPSEGWVEPGKILVTLVFATESGHSSLITGLTL